MDIQRIIAQNKALYGSARGGSVTLDGISGKIEGVFRALNMNTPAMRAVLVAGVVSGALHVFKPSIMFSSNGAPKEWDALADPQNPTGNETTWAPWYVAAIGTGIAAGIFI